MYLKTFQICILKYTNLILQNVFHPAPGLAWQAALKKAQVKLDLWTNIDILLIVEKGIRGGITLFIDMQKLITNTWKAMRKMKNRHIFNIGI